jgi:hypothetical protein
MQISVPAPRLSELTGRVEPLEAVIVQAMEKRPAARFDTADEMLAAIDRALPLGVVAEYATGSERRPPRRTPELANHPTLVAPGDRAAGAEAAASSARLGGPSRRLARAATGAALGLLALAAIVVAWVGQADRDGGPPAAGPESGVTPGTPEAVAPAPPAVSPAPATAPPALPDNHAREVARPADTTVQVKPAVPRQAAAAPAGRAHKSVGGARRHGKKRGGESDLDSPLNPYAR